MENEEGNRKEYFALLKSCWAEARVEMLNALNGIAKIDAATFKTIMENPVVKKRLSVEHPKVRPLLLRLCFEACGGKDWKKIIPACAAVELLNISTYVTNAFFDEKGGQKMKEEKDSCIIAGMLLREVAEEELLKCQGLVDGDDFAELIGRFIGINKSVYVGQDIDLRQLKIEKLDNFSSFDELKDLYFKRTELFCGKFMENIALMGAVFAKANKEQREALAEFGFNYGSGIQIANDVGDFVPFSSGNMDFEKAYQDQYSDIRHGKLTLATLLAIEKPEPNSIFKNLKSNPDEKELAELTKYLNESKIVAICKEQCVKRFNSCKQQLQKLPDTKARQMLSIMASMLRTNKYFSFFRELAV